ncbi:hypothetical protein FRC12_019254 [Ceratobasidium sp. 428]|nr:hypothetical protein FRC12_019254 [Ceratobasidium sp. 428]
MPPKQQQKASGSKVKDDKSRSIASSTALTSKLQKNKSAKVQKDIARINTEQSRAGKSKQEARISIMA